MWNDVELLDLETANASFDIPFWKSLIDEHRPAQVLELACGTGRLTFPLAERGIQINTEFHITGLDLSKSFIDHAHSKLEDSEPQTCSAVSFIVGDMRSFEFSEEFDLIIIPFNSFALLLETEDQFSCLEAVKRGLSSDGHFVIDVVAPFRFQETFAAGERPLPVMRAMSEWQDANGAVEWFHQQCFEKYDPLQQVIRRVIYSHAHFAEGKNKEFRQEVRYRALFPREMELLFRLANLRPVAKYGDYDRSPFNSRSSSYLWVFQHQ